MITVATSLSVRSFRAIGTVATVVVDDPAHGDLAETTLAGQLAALDLACSRFRPDAEIWDLYRASGRPVEVSPLLFEVIECACRVAAETRGAVDPTVGAAVYALGYDRDFASVPSVGPRLVRAPVPAPGWWQIDLDHRVRTVRVPIGVRLDLGATAKAFVVDRSVAAIADRTTAGVLVSVGGDVAVAGPPPEGGWAVGIAVDSGAPLHAVDQVVAVRDGGLASSSPGVRSWVRGGQRLHHIVDPASGECAPAYWALVSAAAPSCVAANAATTATIVRGASGLARLVEDGVSARLVRHDGEVITINGWPDGGRRAWLTSAEAAK